ncbi:MFS transporter [Burkholderia sp. DN3021]|uniref:MFS transporter n=1 Tax=Burkholderia sp. DN3021 TaxID=3410137 RepID=UPI003C7A5758
MPNDHRQRRHTLWLLCALSFILYVDRVNLATTAGAIKAELGLSNTELGIAFSAFAYSYAICQIGGGWIADRFGARITLIGCGLIWVVSTVTTGLVHSLALLFAARLLLGIGEGATLPAQARAITHWFPRERRGVVQGFTHSFSRLGNAVTPPIVAALMTWLSWRAAFFVIGAVTLVWLAWWIVGFREHPLGDDDGRTRAAARPAPPSDPTPWGPLFRRMAPTIFVYFCYGWTAWLFFTWLPTFFLNGQGLNLKSTALFASGVFFAGVVGDTLGGWLCDRIYRKTGKLALSRQSVIVASFVGALLCLLPLAFVHSTAGIALCLSGSFLCLELTIGPIWAVPSDIAPTHAGIASGMMNAGSAIAGILFGYLVDRTGSWTVPFIGSVAMLMIGIVAALRIRPDRTLSESMPSLADAPAAPSAR